MDDQRLESYLQTMEQHLVGITAAGKLEWRDEARAHLLALVEAHEELGATRDEAVEAALKQFGSGKRIGQALAKAARRAEPLPGRELAWCLSALFWNTFLWRMFMLAEPETGLRPALLCLLFALAHLLTALVLARAPQVRLPKWALHAPFAPYLVFNLLFTAEELLNLSHGWPQLWPERGAMLLILAFNWGSLALCFRVPTILGRPAAPSPEETSLRPA
jgi:hypothetical protein